VLIYEKEKPFSDRGTRRQTPRSLRVDSGVPIIATEVDPTGGSPTLSSCSSWTHQARWKRVAVQLVSVPVSCVVVLLWSCDGNRHHDDGVGRHAEQKGS
jgi:hypothetical protein